MVAFGLDTLVINGDTTSHAHKEKRNLWLEAREKQTLLILSPEEFLNREFTQLANNTTFADRVCKLGVDEIHLLHWWGHSFRPAFRQIGLVRVRLPTRGGLPVSIVGITATLRGATMNTVTKTLGLEDGRYHLLRHSNMRHDIQLIFRELHSGLGGNSFPDLDWILDEGQNTIIFCKTISLGFNVACYLWRCARLKGVIQELDKHIRLFNSLNWASFNLETFELLNDGGITSTITIATDVLSVGWDSKFTRDAIILGEPTDVDEFVQKIGRVGRDWLVVSNPRAFLYYTRGAIATAERVVAAGVQPRVGKSKGEDTMDISMATLLLAECKSQALDMLYDNPQEDIKCSCQRCTRNPSGQRQIACNCSGKNCSPETAMTTSQTITPTEKVAKPRARRGQAISKEMRAYGTAEWERFRWTIFTEADPAAFGFFPPQVFIPDDTIKSLLDNLYSLKNTADVRQLVQHNTLLDKYHTRIFKCCQQMQQEFAAQRAAATVKKKNTTNAEDLDIMDMDSDLDEITMEDTTEETNGQDEALPKWRLNLR